MSERENLIVGLEREVATLRNIYTRIEVMTEDDSFTNKEVKRSLMEALKVSTNIAVNLLVPVVSTLLVERQSADEVIAFLDSICKDVLQRSIYTVAEQAAFAMNESEAEEFVNTLLEKVKKDGPAKTNTH